MEATAQYPASLTPAPTTSGLVITHKQAFGNGVGKVIVCVEVLAAAA
jgi:hypothetical protein